MDFIKKKKNLKEDTVVLKIIREIKDALIKEELKPGDKFPTEEQLCNKFSISRASVREAMKMLSALGVIIIKPGHGTNISNGENLNLIDPIVFRLIIKKRTFDKLEELRRMLELGMLELVIENQTPEDIMKMEKSIQLYEKAYLQGVTDSETLANYDLDFHLAFTEATHNDLVIEIATSVYQLYILSFYKILDKPAIVKRALTIHKMILEGIKEKNIQKTREILNINAKKWKEEISSDIS